MTRGDWLIGPHHIIGGAIAMYLGLMAWAGSVVAAGGLLLIAGWCMWKGVRR